MKIKLLIITLFSVYVMSSCVTPKKVLYLQDMEEMTQIEIENKFEAVICPYDELNIIVSCSDQNLQKSFNILNDSQMGNNNKGYLVDVDGNIVFPVIGQIHVAGMTRLELQNYIKNVLETGEYIKNPFVNVRFSTFKIFFLSPEGGKSISVPNERCTFLEALALSGGIDQYTRRDKIGVLRNVDGKMMIHYMDPRSSKIFNDPFYLLQQNDFIITEAIKSKYYKEEFSYWMSWIALVTSISSIITMIAVLVK